MIQDHSIKQHCGTCFSIDEIERKTLNIVRGQHRICVQCGTRPMRGTKCKTGCSEQPVAQIDELTWQLGDTTCNWQIGLHSYAGQACVPDEGRIRVQTYVALVLITLRRAQNPGTT